MMNNNLKKLADNRFREVQGFSYDELIEGLTIEHRPGRTLTETDNIWQSLMSMNSHPMHIDHVYAEQTDFGHTLISSPITLAIVTGMSVKNMSAQAIANLGWDKVKLKAPVFVGDTIYAESTVIEKRLSKSRKNCAVVTIHSKAFNQDDELVISFDRTYLMPVEPQAPENY